MDPYDLIKKLNGEIALNRAQTRINGKYVTIVTFGAGGPVITEEGHELAKELYNKEVSEVVKKAPKPRKPRATTRKPITINADQEVPETEDQELLDLLGYSSTTEASRKAD